jgi:hypothetical protein
MTFRKLAKFVAAPLAVLALTGAHYHCDRVSINFPDVWEAPKTEAAGLVTINQGATGARKDGSQAPETARRERPVEANILDTAGQSSRSSHPRS